MFGTRQISDSSLRDRIREIERVSVGTVSIPHFLFSKYITRYLRTEGDVEIYSRGKEDEVRVGPHQVIDTLGNVLNIVDSKQRRVNPMFRNVITEVRCGYEKPLQIESNFYA